MRCIIPVYYTKIGQLIYWQDMASEDQASEAEDIEDEGDSDNPEDDQSFASIDDLDGKIFAVILRRLINRFFPFLRRRGSPSPRIIQACRERPGVLQIPPRKRPGASGFRPWTGGWWCSIR